MCYLVSKEIPSSFFDSVKFLNYIS